MFSPAGQAWLHGGKRSRTTGRWVRHAPVLLARLEPTSRVIAYGLSIDDLLVQQAELVDIAIGHHLNLCNALEVGRIAEQMGFAFLQLEVFAHRDFVPDRRPCRSGTKSLWPNTSSCRNVTPICSAIRHRDF